MVNWVVQKVIGTHHDRARRRLWPVVERVNAFEPQLQQLSDSQLRAKTDEFRARLRKELAPHQFLTPASPEWYDLNHDERAELRGQRRVIQQKALDAILPEAFAVVREAARRTVNMRHFDVPLPRGLILP